MYKVVVLPIETHCFFAVLVYVAVVLALALKRGFISMVTPKDPMHRLKLS